jgi:hypothetical protein
VYPVHWLYRLDCRGWPIGVIDSNNSSNYINSTSSNYYNGGIRAPGVVSTMGELIQVEGREVPVEDGTTVQDLKERLDRDDDELATYEENGEVKVLGDRDVVADAVPEGTNVSFQPGEGQVFGRPGRDQGGHDRGGREAGGWDGRPDGNRVGRPVGGV